MKYRNGTFYEGTWITEAEIPIFTPEKYQSTPWHRYATAILHRDTVTVFSLRQLRPNDAESTDIQLVSKIRWSLRIVDSSVETREGCTNPGNSGFLKEDVQYMECLW